MIPPGTTIGIIGGGQLGRMLANAASELGYKTHCYTPEADSPAAQVATFTTIGDYDDESLLHRFAASVDVVTFEFENIPHTSLALLEQQVPVRPSPHLLKLSQNRLREKNFVNAHDIPTADYHRVTSETELAMALDKIGCPAILKTSELGYDGKGQVAVDDRGLAINAWDSLGRVECVLEARVEFAMEISVIVARNGFGHQACYIPVQNIHRNHILDTTIAPADLNRELTQQAKHIALTLAAAADLHGLMAVEMFVTTDGRILVNEIAPRPHNSGHWTQDGCVTSQFEQTIRAVCDLPLGGTERLCDVEMKNLVGEQVDQWLEYAKNPHYKVHLYGKSESRSGRKMGHVNILKP